MKGKKLLTSLMAVATSCICLLSAGCADLGLNLGGNGGGNGGGNNHEHTDWAYIHNDTKHWESPACHPGEKRNESEHVYDDENDATCDICGYERTIEGHTHTGWAYVNTDPDQHWESPSCHPDVKRNEGVHVYTDENDATCNTCGYTRTVTPSHTHTGWAYVNTDPDQHWESPSCHPDVKRNEGVHVYTDDNDTTCNTCGYTRTVTPSHTHTGWAYVKTDPNRHWESPSCHPDVKRNEGVHVYDNNNDATCNTCGYTRIITPPTVAGELAYAYAGNECAAFEWGDSSASSAKVEYKLSDGVSAYTSLDKNLIRQKNSTTARADILGLKGGAKYDFRITTSAGKALTATNVGISAYDRSGYAHFNYTSGVGAYNDDGTPKSNAVIVYVNEANKNTVQAKIGSKTYTGIVSILQNAGTSTPLIVRVLGTVGAATWNKLEENGGKALTPDLVKGRDGTSLIDYYNIIRKGTSGAKNVDLTQATLIKDNFNTLNTSVYSELNGLNSKAKYDASKDEFDSCWNDCSVQNVKNVTLEGVGEDARIFQWGLTFKNCSSIEVRNLTFEDYTEDACSFEGGNTSAKSLSDFDYGNIWMHHNTFEEGVNYWDVCNEQDKHDGDGSTDFKGIKNITISYNKYSLTHKTGLIGGSNSQTTANVTFHHNWYDHCKARLPLGRQANMHMYNNYYNGTTSCSISLRAGAYAFVENCYFDTKSGATSIELQTDSKYGDGSAKIVNCTNASGKIVNNSEDNHLYQGTDRLATVTHTNKFSKSGDSFIAFDMDPTLFYYDSANKKSKVTYMISSPSEVKTIVPQIAGVMKHDSNITGGGSSGGTTTDPDPTPTPDPDPVNPPVSQTITYIPETDGVNGIDKGGVTITVWGGAYKSASVAVTIDGTSISAGKALKLNSTASLSIEVTEAMTLTVYTFLENVSVDSTTYTGTQASGGYYVIEIPLTKGKHTLTKISGGSENWIFMLKLTK